MKQSKEIIAEYEAKRKNAKEELKRYSSLNYIKAFKRRLINKEPFKPCIYKLKTKRNELSDSHNHAALR